jgi:hypothetical protein
MQRRPYFVLAVAFVFGAMGSLVSACGDGSSQAGCTAGQVSCDGLACCASSSPYWCPSTNACFGSLAAANEACPGDTMFNGMPDNAVTCQ